MLPELQIILAIITNIVVLIFVGYYFIVIRAKEKKIKKTEEAIDSDYHHVVDEALSKERKILDDATTEADKIISQTQYLTNDSKQEINNAIRVIVAGIQKDGQLISQAFASEYTASLKNMSNSSLMEFQNIMLGLQTNLKKQIEEFHNSLLPQIEKELENYKITRMQEIDQAVVGIVQKASQEVFNKTISLTDHQNTVISSLEKAKKEGVFD